jgi:hypothetical protein
MMSRETVVPSRKVDLGIDILQEGLAIYITYVVRKAFKLLYLSQRAFAS